MNSRYVESPTYYTPAPGDPPAVFVGGGITGVADFQSVVAAALAEQDCVVLNPRRADYPADDPDAVEEQVAWECHHRKLDRLVMLIWFPASDPAITVQPIALLELGAELARPRSPHRGLVIGADPGYPRCRDVVLQCRYDRPDVTVHASLEETLSAACALLPALPPRQAERDPALWPELGVWADARNSGHWR